MNTDYILTHTPAQIAAEHDKDEIQSAFDSFVLSDFSDPDTLFGGNSLMDGTNEITDVAECEQMLTEWYDECQKDRPGSADDLALAYQLHAALYIKTTEEWDRDH